jgi:hypothetical protein
MKPQIYRSSQLQPLSPFLHCAEASVFSLRLLPLPPPPSLSDPHPPSPKDPHSLLYPLPAHLTPSVAVPKARSLKPNPPAQCLHSSSPPASHHHQPSNHHLNTHSHNSPTITNHLYVAHLRTPRPPPLPLTPTKTTTKPTSANNFPAPEQLLNRGIPLALLALSFQTIDYAISLAPGTIGAAVGFGVAVALT